MTTAQRVMLFSMFNRACQAASITDSIARDQYREQLTIRACGRLVSWSDLDNLQVDTIKAELLAILKPADLDAQLRQIDQPRTRLLHSIEHLADAPYIAKVATDKFGHADVARLDNSKLVQLRNTLANRKRARNAKLKQPEPQSVDVPF